MFYVWRRSDGYVSATAYEPGKYGVGMTNGVPDTFEILLKTEDWSEARTLIETERARMAEQSS